MNSNEALIRASDEPKILFYFLGILGLLIGIILCILQISKYSSFSILKFLIFFFMLGLVHIPIAKYLWEKKNYFLVILSYAIAIDGYIYFFLTQILSFLMLYPLIIATLLILGTKALKYLLNYHLERSRMAKCYTNNLFFHKDLKEEIENIKLDISERNEYDSIVIFSFSSTMIIGYFMNWDLRTLFLSFINISTLTLTSILLLRMYYEAHKMMSQFSGISIPSSSVILSPQGYGISNINSALTDPLELKNQNSDEQIIDYFDRSADIRKLHYYNSVYFVLLITLYLSATTTLSGTLLHSFNIHVKFIAIFAISLAFFFIQVPYYLGQKKLQLELLKSFSGSKHRELSNTLGKQSLAWSIIQTGEILGVGATIPLIFHIISKITKIFNLS